MAKISISRAWDETRAIIARDGKLLATVAAAMFVLPGVISQVVQPNAPAGEFPPFGYWSVIAVVAFLISMIGTLALIRLAIAGGQSVGGAIRAALSRAPAYLAAMILWALPFGLVGFGLVSLMAETPESPPPAAAFGILILAIVALFVIIRMAFTSSVAAVENAGPIGILKRSWDLTRGNWWRLFAFFLLLGIAAGVLLLAVEAVGGSLVTVAFGEAEPLSGARLVIAILYQLISAAFSIVFNVMLARLYVQANGSNAADMEEVFR